MHPEPAQDPIANSMAQEHARDQILMPENKDLSVIAQQQHLENASDTFGNLVYGDDSKEPEIHVRTWIALGAMCMLSLAQLTALQGPPAVVSSDPVYGTLDMVKRLIALPC